jgi:hypothetical protein
MRGLPDRCCLKFKQETNGTAESLALSINILAALVRVGVVQKRGTV